MEYRNQVLRISLDELKPSSDILAVWEGGSAATGTKDQFSDIDLCILASSPPKTILDRVEKSLGTLGVSYTWQPMKSPWGEGLMQRVIVLKDSPKYFFVDVGVFDQAYPQLLQDFLEIERHGQPVIHFDKAQYIKPGHTDAAAMFKRQQLRAQELKQGFLIYKSLVLKEIERQHPIDAIAFYQNGLVKPLIELLGMIYRPYKFDFGMRYIHRSFPQETQKLIEELNYIANFKDLPERVLKVETAFNEAIQKVSSRKVLE